MIPIVIVIFRWKMNIQRAYILSLSLFLLICLYFWCEKLLGYQPIAVVTNDQDAILQGIRRPFGIYLGFIVSSALFLALALYTLLKRMFSVLRTNHQ
jgi:branched-subunit amino acid ABC-type transport system permease component